jgi:hypothetical protein
MWLRRTQGRTMRRAYPIHGYVGPNGGGKSTAAIWDTLPSLDAGRPVLSTVRLVDYANPRPCDDPACTHPEHEKISRQVAAGAAVEQENLQVKHLAAHPCWIPWTNWRQLLDVEHCDVLADEVTGVASSRDSQSMPAQVANALVQLRRRDVTFRWTAPSWSRADLIIRECSQATTFCRGYLPVNVQVGDDEQDRAWRHRRLFKWVTYDAAEVDEMTQGKREKLKPWVFDLHWGPGSPAFAAFDTFDAVSSIGQVSDHGRCMTCGGRRSVPACSCSDYVAPARTRSGGAAARGPRVRGGDAAPADAEVEDGGSVHDHQAGPAGTRKLLPVIGGSSDGPRRAAVR